MTINPPSGFTALRTACAPGAALHALTTYPQFIAHVFTPRRDGSGKLDKVPVSAKSSGAMFYAAGTEASMVDFETAVATVERWAADGAARTLTDGEGPRPVTAYGVGFVFTKNDPFWFCDLDGCRVKDGWAPIAQEICNALAGSAVEVSSSENGLHFIGFGTAPEHGCRGPHGLEFYSSGRFAALTGTRAVGSAAHDATTQLPAVIAKYFPPKNGSDAGHKLDWTTEAVWPASPPQNPGRYAELLAGDAAVLARHESMQKDDGSLDGSAADFNLACELLRIHGGNQQAVLERMMSGEFPLHGKRSGNEDWLRRTVNNAFAEVSKNPPLDPAKVGFGTGPVPAGMMAPTELSVEMAALHPVVRDEILASLPSTLFLSNDHLEPNVAAERIFTYLGSQREMYRRGDAVVELNPDKRLIHVSSTMFRSRLNKRGRRVRAFKLDSSGTKVIHLPKLCSEDAAKLLLSASAVERLPEIKLVTRMPVLIERDRQLQTTVPGYNAECGVLVTTDVAIPTVPLTEAAIALRDLLCDFLFAEPGDKARALAGFIAPGLRMGGLLHGDALITSIEADQSQAGKGFKLKIDRAIYGEPAYPVAQREGGVGSFDESLAQALLSGTPFVNFDNLRGTVRSAYLESIITAGADRIPVRVPHRGEVQVDISRTSFQLTSNGFSSTVDLSNRLLMIRLSKQPVDYKFTPWPEGGLLQRVGKYAAYYLGCVHAVIRHWYLAGKPCLATEHTFKEWVGTLDWIVQNVWETVPLLDGHSAAAARVASPSLSWLRQVGFVVIREGQAGHELRAGDLREICERHDLLPDGIKPSWEENAIERAIGKMMGSCFATGVTTLKLDSIQVTRVEREVTRENYQVRPIKFYKFETHHPP